MDTTATTISCSEVWGDNRAVATTLSLPGLSGWVLARPYRGQEAGGDVHYVSSCGTGRIARLLIADVSGHGEEVAAVGGSLRRLMQRYMNHIDPRTLAAQMNRDIGGLVDGGRFVTAVVLTYFAPDGGLSLCNAGHPPPMLYRKVKNAWSPIQQPDTAGKIANLPLGILEESGYEGRELTLDPGDVMLLYSDCLIEARRPDRGGGGEDTSAMLDVAGLCDTLNNLAGETGAPRSPQGWVDALLARLAVEGYALDDDLTAVAFECTQRSGGASGLARVAGVWRGFVLGLKGLLSRAPVPWPELSRVGIVGIFVPRLRRDRA